MRKRDYPREQKPPSENHAVEKQHGFGKNKQNGSRKIVFSMKIIHDAKLYWQWNRKEVQYKQDIESVFAKVNYRMRAQQILRAAGMQGFLLQKDFENVSLK